MRIKVEYYNGLFGKKVKIYRISDNKYLGYFYNVKNKLHLETENDISYISYHRLYDDIKPYLKKIEKFLNVK